MKDQDIRWIQRFDNYTKAFKQLESGAKLAGERELSDLEKQGLIQAFEYTHELAWKTLKDFLSNKGNKDFYGSKDVTREAFQYGLVKDGEVWMDMISNRNKSSHTYNQDTANQIVDAILNKYYQEFDELNDRLADLKLKE